MLFCSMRRDGKTLGQMAREERLAKSGACSLSLITVLLIMIVLLAVVGLVVVNALKGSPTRNIHDRDDHPDCAHGLISRVLASGESAGMFGARIPACAGIFGKAVAASSAERAVPPGRR